jgi:hypothetical protein
MPITIHPELEARLRARAEASGVTVETYIERIARDDQAAEDELSARTRRAEVRRVDGGRRTVLGRQA